MQRLCASLLVFCAWHFAGCETTVVVDDDTAGEPGPEVTCDGTKSEAKSKGYPWGHDDFGHAFACCDKTTCSDWMDDGCKGCACCSAPDIKNPPAGCSSFDDVCMPATGLSKMDYENMSTTVTDEYGTVFYGFVWQALCECWNINR